MSVPTFLERSSVSATSRRRYQLEYEQFLRWAQAHRRPTTTAQQLDVSLTAYMNELYFQGGIGSEATKLIAAVTFMRQDLRRGSQQLPRSIQAARGWVRLSPSHSRLPTPWPLLCLILRQLALQHRVHEAFASLLQFALYLRPSETLRILARNVVRPTGRRARCQDPAQWALVLHPREDLQPSKVGAYDESMTLDSPLLRPAVPFLQKRLRDQPDGRLFDLEYGPWAATFKAAALEAGIPAPLVPTLYQSRHGGATYEAYHQVRSWEAIQARGRWADQKGMRRYCKPGRLEHQLQRLPPWVRAAAEDAAESAGSFLLALSRSG